MKIKYKLLTILLFFIAVSYFSCDDYTDDFPVPDPSTVARFEIIAQNNFVAPDVIMFRNTSTVPERAGDPTFYWDFGDGDTYQTPSFDSIYHTYENIGTYNVSLMVKTSAGDSSFTSEKIELIDILLGDTLLFEDFESSGLFPDNWVLENIDGKTPAGGVGLPALADSAWVVRYSGLMGSNVAIGTSYYEESPSTADDWFILPKISIGANAALQWQGMSFTSSGDYPDDYEIYISTTTKMINYDLCYKYQISHEIGHLWFGLNTKYDTIGRNFMAESINEYVNLLNYKYNFGDSAYYNLVSEQFIKAYSNYKCSFDDVLSAKKVFDSDSGFYPDLLIYVKGPRFLIKLSEMIGEKKLTDIIRDTYNQRKKLLTILDFEATIKKYKCWDEYRALYQIEL